MTTDSYRVIYTTQDGATFADPPMDKASAVERFNERLLLGGFAGKARLAVMSDHEWCKVQPLGGAS